MKYAIFALTHNLDGILNYIEENGGTVCGYAKGRINKGKKDLNTWSVANVETTEDIIFILTLKYRFCYIENSEYTYPALIEMFAFKESFPNTLKGDLGFLGD